MNTRQRHRETQKIRGARLRAERDAQGYSLRELALMVNCDHKTIYRVERGHRAWLETWESLADALDVSPAWLLFGEGTPEGP